MASYTGNNASKSFASYKGIQLLSSGNYLTWKKRVISVLTEMGVYETVFIDPKPSEVASLGETPEARTLREEAVKNWKTKNAKALSLLLRTIDDSQAGTFLDAGEAAQLMRDLEVRHLGAAEARCWSLRTQLEKLTWDQNETPADYVGRLKLITKQSTMLGQPISEAEAINYAVRGIKQSNLRSLRTALSVQRGLTYEVFQQAMEDELATDCQPTPDVTEAQALKTSNVRRKGVKCFNCGRSGHYQRECRVKSTEGLNKPATSQPASFQKKRRSSRRQQAKSIANKAQPDESIDETEDRSYHVEVLQSSSARNTGRFDWNLDSGTTIHMTPHQEWLRNTQPYQSTVRLADGSQRLRGILKGELEACLESKPGVFKNFTLRDVVLVPGLDQNLMSVKAFARTGMRVYFDDDDAVVVVKSTGVQCVYARSKADDYIVHGKPHFDHTCASLEEGLPVIIKTSDAGKAQDTLLWHRRLGHTSRSTLNEMLHKGMLRDFTADTIESLQCPVCVQTKMTAMPHRAYPPRCREQCLDLIHMDLMGPFQVPSNKGSKYTMVIVDDASRRIFVDFLKQKSEALDKFKDFVLRRENQKGRTIKTVRTDNGLEFCSAQFEDYLRQKGIKHETTVAYTPQQNGVAERANRTIVEMARALLCSARLPLRFWAEAIATAAYIQNIVVHKATGTRTPIEIWSEKKPTAAHLRVFGCLAFYRIPQTQRRKLNNTARPAIFLGYCRTKRAYRLYDPELQKLLECCDVVFHEDTPGSSLLVDRPQGENLFTELQEMDDSDEEQEQEQGQEQGQEQEQEQGQEQGQDQDQEQECPIVNELEPAPIAEATVPRRGRPPGLTRTALEDRANARREEHNRLRAERGDRVSTRLLEKRRHDQANAVFDEVQTRTPTTFEEAIASPEKEQWMEALTSELDSLQQNDVWELRPPPDDLSKVINSK